MVFSIQSFAFHDFRLRLSIVQTSLTLLSACTEIRLVVESIKHSGFAQIQATVNAKLGDFFG